MLRNPDLPIGAQVRYTRATTAQGPPEGWTNALPAARRYQQVQAHCLGFAAQCRRL